MRELREFFRADGFVLSLRACVFCCFILLSVTLRGAAVSTSADGKDRPGDGDISALETLEEVFGILRGKDLMPSLTPEMRRRMINAVLAAMDCKAELVSGGAGEVSESGDGDGGELPVLGHLATVGGLFKYVQILTFTENSADELRLALGDFKYGHYEGIVLDLRYSGGQAVEAAGPAADLIRGLEVVPVLLINGETRGAAEVFGMLVAQNSRCISVGQPTKGRPALRVSSTLASGDVVLLPYAGENARDARWKQDPIYPDLKIAEVLSRDFLRGAARFEQPGDIVSSDQCLRKAVDLLTAVAGFQKKHF